MNNTTAPATTYRVIKSGNAFSLLVKGKVISSHRSFAEADAAGLATGLRSIYGV